MALLRSPRVAVVHRVHVPRLERERVRPLALHGRKGPGKAGDVPVRADVCVCFPADKEFCDKEVVVDDCGEQRGDAVVVGGGEGFERSVCGRTGVVDDELEEGKVFVCGRPVEDSVAGLVGG